MTDHDDRLSREFGSRERDERPKQWTLAQVLPEPESKHPDYDYRWIRVSLENRADTRNVSSKFREGWEPVSIEDHPEYKGMTDPDSRFSSGIEIDGVLLCKMPKTMTAQRADHFKKMNAAQTHSVDNNFMRESDARMPLFQEKKSRVQKFGNGN